MTETESLAQQVNNLCHVAAKLEQAITALTRAIEQASSSLGGQNESHPAR
jgi:hypothetical protein